MDQHVISIEHGARLPRLAMEADGPANTKTRERTKVAATAVQAMSGDSFSARRVEPGPNTNSTSFGVKAEPPALPCRGDVVVESSDAAPKLCFPSLEMRLPTAAGGSVPTGKTSTATKTNFNQPPLRFYSTKKTDSNTNLRISTPCISCGSSVFQTSNPPAAPYGRRVTEKKTRKNRAFDPGGSQGHPRACLFLGSWRALVCGEVRRAGAAE